MTEQPIDRRAAHKERHRRAILDAAAALVAERGVPDLGVDELAARADVSRRTVFNYFASLDDIVLTIASESLEQVIDQFFDRYAATATGPGSRDDLFDELGEMLRIVDLPSTIASLYRVLGDPACGAQEDPRRKQLVVQTFDRVAAHLSEEIARRRPGVDRVDIDLLVTSLVHGIGVIAQHWIATTDRTGPDAVAAWDHLTGRLLLSVRAGFMPEQ
jgi:AcrR family transcriptional regulator